MGYRKLVPEDRVRIIGPWLADAKGNGGQKHIGKTAVVLGVLPGSEMPIALKIPDDYGKIRLYWCRENLRALPRKEEVK